MTTETAITAQKEGNGELNPKQMMFVKGFVENGGNATKAYLAAGYAPKAAMSGASQLLSKVNVSRAIQAALKEKGYTPDAIRCKLLAYVVNDPRDFEPWFLGEKTLEQLAAAGVDTTTIQEMMTTVKPGKNGDQVTRKLRFYDSQLATTTLGKMLGLLDERRHLSVSGMVGVAALDLRDKSPEELATIQAALALGKPPPGFEKQMSADPKEQLTAALIDEASR